MRHAGLSPLARGTLLRKTQKRLISRFIPAGAGNTWPGQSSPMSCAVYPRWRGEHSLIILVICYLAGLSPLARGTQLVLALIFPICRFIPAGAGNTLQHYRYGQSHPVYPRWRGEHTTHLLLNFSVNGLSPLARGTPVNRCIAVHEVRFIPAGAGNTS